MNSKLVGVDEAPRSKLWGIKAELRRSHSKIKMI